MRAAQAAAWLTTGTIFGWVLQKEQGTQLGAMMGYTPDLGRKKVSWRED